MLVSSQFKREHVRGILMSSKAWTCPRYVGVKSRHHRKSKPFSSGFYFCICLIKQISNLSSWFRFLEPDFFFLNTQCQYFSVTSLEIWQQKFSPKSTKMTSNVIFVYLNLTDGDCTPELCMYHSTYTPIVYDDFAF